MQIVIVCMFMVAILGIFLYGMRQAVIINRRWKLTRNVDWALEHSTYVEKLLQPSFLPFIVATLVAIVPIIWAVVQQPAQLLEFYIGGLLGGILLLFVMYIPIEILIARKIPTPEVRFAKLAPRTLSSYLHPVLVIAAVLCIVLIFTADILYYQLHILSKHHLISNLITHGGIFGIMGVSLFSTLTERPIHQRSIAKLSDVDIYETARKWGVYVLAGGFGFVIIFSAVQLAGQWFGYELSYPLANFLHEKMNVTISMQPMIPKDLHTLLAAIEGVMVIPVLYLVFNCTPVKMITTLKFTKNNT